MIWASLWWVWLKKRWIWKRGMKYHELGVSLKIVDCALWAGYRSRSWFDHERMFPKVIAASDRKKSSFDSNSYFWSFDVIINKWNEMIEQVRNDENNISPRSPLYFGWDVKQLRFFENLTSRGSKNFLLFWVSSKWRQSGFQKDAKRKHDSRNNDKCISTTSNTIQILIIEFRNLKNTNFLIGRYFRITKVHSSWRRKKKNHFTG